MTVNGDSTNFNGINLLEVRCAASKKAELTFGTQKMNDTAVRFLLARFKLL
jgi:hypothetical protein